MGLSNNEFQNTIILSELDCVQNYNITQEKITQFGRYIIESDDIYKESPLLIKNSGILTDVPIIVII